MFRKTSLLPSLVIFLAAFVLFATSTTGFAENRGDDLRQAIDYVHRCDVPFNIQDGSYNTGLHIIPDWTGDVTFTFKFYSGGDPYATRTLTIDPEGWSGLASELLGGELVNPTLIIAFSHKDPDSAGIDVERFWITQF